MQLLGLTDQKRIAEVIDYLVDIQQKNETVEDVMEKFGLSPEESARYAETNSFRLNPDRTVTEGMKLILPKH